MHDSNTSRTCSSSHVTWVISRTLGGHSQLSSQWSGQCYSVFLLKFWQAQGVVTPKSVWTSRRAINFEMHVSHGRQARDSQGGIDLARNRRSIRREVTDLTLSGSPLPSVMLGGDSVFLLFFIDLWQSPGGLFPGEGWTLCGVSLGVGISAKHSETHVSRNVGRHIWGGHRAGSPDQNNNASRRSM